ncbi:conserved exported hypothetical protein [uncultured Pleomorphomonas sp.]|uniref:RpoE-regulated lipoprotein n=2 Tax=uncultured Pleomorphomonas sp. TaxID=442121 RepID=A0A212LDG3_9HYPH|nr:conserved exported hypothetical protein [uncultured Pleomorphomonas sp.]
MLSRGMTRIPTLLRLSGVLMSAALAGCSLLGSDSDFTPPPSRAATFRITAAGVPGLPPGTAFSKKAIEALEPGYVVSSVTMATEQSESVAALALFREGLQVLQVLPGPGGKIGAVHGVSESLVGPNGERIGMTFRETRVDRAACREGQGNWLGMPICTARGAPNVTFVFAIPGYISAGSLPDDVTLAGATLQRIIWVPPVG